MIKFDYEQVKNWPWKRIMIGTAVISSIAASSSFGTYAYFTSQVNESTAFAAGKLEIALGTTSATFKAEADQPFLPGVRFEKDLAVENNSDVPVKYALLAEKKSGDDVVYNQLVVEIERDGDLLYRGRVSQLSQANVVIPELAEGHSDPLHYTVYLPESTGNEVQQKTAEVDFGFLATQQDNGEYFAQKGPVMTFTPENLNGRTLQETLSAMGDNAEGLTFVLADGAYDLGSVEMNSNITWKAANGKDAKVVIKADDLRVKNASFENITFDGSGVIAESNVSFSNCVFDGASIQTAEAKEGTLENLTVKNSRFVGADHAIVLNQAITAVLVDGNTFEGVEHALVVANDKATQVQIVNNDFKGVSKYAVESNGVRVGDGIDGFTEIAKEGKKPLALHLRQADFYLENNEYGK
ncbi:right-handed parallel beta-helix repeat-containing protein [Brevibacillus sp. H7]|uniref:right-handed parallel beta-helix repeat-containing protein n=1 Tax=Brevibacillus sp. H7 TaxID=3349138 RepID=UPI0038150007